MCVKKKEEKKTMGLTEMLFLCRGWTLKNSWRTAMADSAMDYEVIFVANRSIEKMCSMKNASFFLKLRKRKLHVRI